MTSESWANAIGPRALQPMTTHDATFGVIRLGSKVQSIDLPLGMNKNAAYIQPMQLKKNVALNQEIKELQSAFEACHQLTVLAQERDLDRILAHESAELGAWADEALIQLQKAQMQPALHCQSWRQKTDALAPRGLAITILSRGPQKVETMHILNAIAHIAFDPDSYGYLAVTKNRIAFVHGETAEKYTSNKLRQRSPAEEGRAKTMPSTMNGRNHSAFDVCLSWVEDLISEVEETDPKTGKLRKKTLTTRLWRSEFAPIPSGLESASAYAHSLLEIILKLWQAHNCPRELGRLASEYSDLVPKENLSDVGTTIQDPLNSAYETATHKCSEFFWGVCKQPSDLQKIIGIPLTLEYTQMYARLVLKPGLKDEHGHNILNGGDCFFATLLHEKGFKDDMVEYCLSCREGNSNIYGLKPPLPHGRQHECRPHVAFIAHELRSLCTEVSLFGLANAPGKKFCNYPNTNQSSAIDMVQLRVLPINDDLCKSAFILPCGIEGVELPLTPRGRDQNYFYYAYFDKLLDEAFIPLQIECNENTPSTVQLDHSFSTKRVTPKDRIPTEEEMKMLVALKMDVLRPSLRLGDAVNELVAARPDEAITRLARTLMLLNSPETSFLEAIEDLACTLGPHTPENDQFILKMQSELIKLRGGNTVFPILPLTIVNNASSNSLSSSVDTAAAPPKSQVAEASLEKQGVANLMACFGLEKGGSPVKLNLPRTAVDDYNIHNHVLLALGLPILSKKPSPHTNKLLASTPAHNSLLEVIATVAHHELTNAAHSFTKIAILCVPTDFYIVNDKGKPDKVASIDIVNMNPKTTAFLFYSEKKKQILYMSRKQKGVKRPLDGPSK